MDRCNSSSRGNVCGCRWKRRFTWMQAENNFITGTRSVSTAFFRSIRRKRWGTRKQGDRGKRPRKRKQRAKLVRNREVRCQVMMPASRRCEVENRVDILKPVPEVR